MRAHRSNPWLPLFILFLATGSAWSANQCDDHADCDDGNACTLDLCLSDVTGDRDCENRQRVCDDDSITSIDSCDPTSGCVFQVCDCEGADAIEDGQCVARTPLWDTLWQSPDGTEPQDLCQGRHNTARYEQRIGQTFIPEDPNLHRIDFLISNRYDSRRFMASLWKWETDCSTTIGTAKLWDDELVLPGSPEWETVSFYPQITLIPGDTYYVELFTPDPEVPEGSWQVAVYDSDEADGYTDGSEWRDCSEKSEDLWFRTYGEPDGGEVTLPASMSDAGVWEDPLDPADPGSDLGRIDLEMLKTIVKDRADRDRQALLDPEYSGEYSHLLAALDAFLYKIGETCTCPADYCPASCEQSVMDAVARSAEFLAGNKTIAHDYSQHIYWAYLWVNGIPEEDRDEILRVMLRAGQESEDAIEAGLNNRNITRRLALRMAAEAVADFEALSVGPLFPQPLTDADRERWIRLSDEVWNDFLNEFDHQEDSTHYTNLAWRYLMQFVEVVDPDGVQTWSRPEFRVVIERALQWHTPLGPGAVYGDANGINQTWLSSFLMFLRAANAYGDPEFETAAYRVADFQRTRASGTQLWYRSIYQEWLVAAMAYFELEKRGPDAEVQEPCLAGVNERAMAGQTTVDAAAWTVTSAGLGQTFKATDRELARLDVKVHNAGNDQDGQIGIWSWDDTTQSRGDLLFLDRLELPSQDWLVEISIYPYVDMVPGNSYLIEFSRDIPFWIAGSRDDPRNDLYKSGSLQGGGTKFGAADLWFRASSLDERGSTVTYRKEVLNVPRAEQAQPYPDDPTPSTVPRQFHRFGSEWVPSKLALRSGPNPENLFALVNLAAGSYSHAQQETGSIVAVTDDGSVLMDGTSYTHGQRKHETGLVVQGYSGGTNTAAPLVNENVVVDLFRDYRNSTVAFVGWNNLRGRNLRQERRFFLVKDRFLVVRDHVEFAAGDDLDASIGNLWRGYDIGEARGPNWFVLYDRVPKALAYWEYRNPERYLMLYLVDRDGVDGRIDQTEDRLAGIPDTARHVVSHRIRHEPEDPRSVWLDSVLLPFRDDEPADLAQKIVVLSSDPQAVVLRIEVGDEVWTLLDNPSGDAVQAPGVATDADYLITRTRSGAEPYVLTSKASFVNVDHRGIGPDHFIQLTWPNRNSLELGSLLDGTNDDCSPPGSNGSGATPIGDIVELEQNTNGQPSVLKPK